MKRKKMILLRVEKGLSQKELGDMLGVTSQCISTIETGKVFGSGKFWYKFKTAFDIPDEEIESYKRLY